MRVTALIHANNQSKNSNQIQAKLKLNTQNIKLLHHACMVQTNSSNNCQPEQKTITFKKPI